MKWGEGNRRERENSNSKTLIFKDNSFRSIWTCPTASPYFGPGRKEEGGRKTFEVQNIYDLPPLPPYNLNLSFVFGFQIVTRYYVVTQTHSSLAGIGRCWQSVCTERK